MQHQLMDSEQRDKKQTGRRYKTQEKEEINNKMNIGKMKIKNNRVNIEKNNNNKNKQKLPYCLSIFFQLNNNNNEWNN